MDLGLKGRVAIVGGSSRGIGRAIALAFAQEGASVTICARTEADLRRTEIELARVGSQHHVLAIPADLSVARDIRRVIRDTVNRFGQIGILVTRLGSTETGEPSEFSDDAITGAMDRNFMGPIRLAREVVPYMKQQRWGRIINLLPSQVKHSIDGQALGVSSELALLGYSKMLSNELAPFNITVNNVMTGLVKTEFMSTGLESQAQKANHPADVSAKETTGQIPMGRLGKPEEIGGLVAFLGSDRAAYMTGAKVVIDGGRLQTLY